MFQEIVDDNLLVLGEAVEVYAKKPSWIPIPVKGKFGMTLPIQKEGYSCLETQILKNWSLKCLKLEVKKSEIFLLD